MDQARRALNQVVERYPIAITRSLVELMGGIIGVHSEGEGHGTKMYFSLPVWNEDDEKAPAGEEGEHSDRIEGPAGGPVVLLVEDDAVFRHYLAALLHAAATPGEAIRLAEAHAGEIHLLMTDVVMPEMNGRDLARNLLSLYPQQKCLFMSGYTANVIAHHGVLDEGVEFLQKPYSPRDLAARVRTLLDRSA